MSNKRVLVAVLLSSLFFNFCYGCAAQATQEQALSACMARLDRIKAEAAQLETVQLFPFQQGYHRFGYRDKTGKIIIPPRFKGAEPFFQGRAIVMDRNGYQEVIDSKGNVVIPYKFIWLSGFMDGVATFSGIKEDRNQNGVIDFKGNILLRFWDAEPYPEFSGFKNGRTTIYRYPKIIPYGNPVPKSFGTIDCTGRITMEGE